MTEALSLIYPPVGAGGSFIHCKYTLHFVISKSVVKL